MEANVITSRMCDVNVIGEPHLVMKADLSVVCKDGKYGLVHTSKLNSDECGDLHEKELILPFEYDNLFFVEIDCIAYLFAAFQGKQGVFQFEGRGKAGIEEVIVTELLPCIYNRIELGIKTDVLYLYDGDKILCYSLPEKKVFTECEYYEELCNGFLLCTQNGEIKLWNTYCPGFITKLDTYEILHIGSYERGEVFKLIHWNGRESKNMEQLLFCGFQGDEFSFSPIASEIVLHTKIRKKGCLVVGIEMSFGNWKDKFSVETVNEITKSKYSFEKERGRNFDVCDN
ncbi:MAG: hypothetical protein IJE09_06640 [Oscillospiraceae bacterium]|nr:hypothetical protein [Oscillospiraceae bacterium]